MPPEAPVTIATLPDEPLIASLPPDGSTPTAPVDDSASLFRGRRPRDGNLPRSFRQERDRRPGHAGPAWYRQRAMSAAGDPIIFVVDDDRSVRESLRRLLTSVGLTVEVFPSAQAFLGTPRPDSPVCL